MEDNQLKLVLEAALLAAGRPLTLDNLAQLFEENDQPDRATLRRAIELLQHDYQSRSLEVREVGSGFRIQVRQDFAEYVARLSEERPQRYSRALMETLALIAYRQPITRGEIEEVRGVSVSTSIIQTLQEREWVRIVGHREVPGRPAVYGTTREFLDYFNLKGLDGLPTLAELRDLDEIHRELELDLGPAESAEAQEADGAQVAEGTALAGVPVAEGDARPTATEPSGEDSAVEEPLETPGLDAAVDSTTPTVVH